MSNKAECRFILSTHILSNLKTRAETLVVGKKTKKVTAISIWISHEHEVLNGFSHMCCMHIYINISCSGGGGWW